MKFKIYNQEDGTVKVTKIAPSGTEQLMFSNIQKGQVAEVEVIATTSYSACLTGVSMEEKNNDLAQ